MSVTNAHHSTGTHLIPTSVRSPLEPNRQRKLPVNRILPPIRICAFRASCKASVCHSDRDDPACSRSKGH
jgi:hypothetical protein